MVVWSTLGISFLLLTAPWMLNHTSQILTWDEDSPSPHSGLWYSLVGRWCNPWGTGELWSVAAALEVIRKKAIFNHDLYCISKPFSVSVLTTQGVVTNCMQTYHTESNQMAVCWQTQKALITCAMAKQHAECSGTFHFTLMIQCLMYSFQYWGDN